jgi:uncharacterized protein (DUF488 family)
VSQHIWVNFDDPTDTDKSLWITNRYVFEVIFGRVRSLFKNSELTCLEECFRDHGIEGVELSYVEKNCFNVFCLRFKAALNNYPDEEEIEYQRVNEDKRGRHETVIWEWKEILRRLEMDKRYDGAWIENYRREHG